MDVIKDEQDCLIAINVNNLCVSMMSILRILRCRNILFEPNLILIILFVFYPAFSH
jgi:hypothetical protein